MIPRNYASAAKGELPPPAKAEIVLGWKDECGPADVAAAGRTFDQALQRGVRMWLPVGVSVAETLEVSLGLQERQLDAIQTIFLNSSPVDDPETTLVGDGAVLALSASMPGLVGAAMRRGGAFSSLRATITASEADTPMERSQGVVTVKVFNVLLDEVGPSVLARGVLLPARELHDLLSQASDSFWDCVDGLTVNGVHVDPSRDELSFPATDVSVFFRIG